MLWHTYRLAALCNCSIASLLIILSFQGRLVCFLHLEFARETHILYFMVRYGNLPYIWPNFSQFPNYLLSSVSQGSTLPPWRGPGVVISKWLPSSYCDIAVNDEDTLAQLAKEYEAASAGAAAAAVATGGG
jgi:hypothetical protein